MGVYRRSKGLRAGLFAPCNGEGTDDWRVTLSVMTDLQRVGRDADLCGGGRGIILLPKNSASKLHPDHDILYSFPGVRSNIPQSFYPGLLSDSMVNKTWGSRDTIYLSLTLEQQWFVSCALAVFLITSRVVWQIRYVSIDMTCWHLRQFCPQWSRLERTVEKLLLLHSSCVQCLGNFSSFIPPKFSIKKSWTRRSF